MDLGPIIQLSVAPVFLLAGIAGFLNVMSGRLGRIIDRSRIITRRISRLEEGEEKTASKKELSYLYRRTQIINRSIGLCTSSALSVCILIVCLFASGILNIEMRVLIEALFIMSMLLLIAALMFFLKEVQLATRTLKVAREHTIDNLD